MANDHSQIVPSMQPTAKVADFKFWCQKVLPLVYDDSLSYYEVLNKMVVYLNQVIDNINADIDNVAELEDDFLLLQQYVNNFFDDIDQLVTYTERAEAAQTAAATSAINAASSASNAASSASNAASSSGSAATSALSAMDAKDAAVAAKTAAETALANAQTAATNAAASATAAGNSATAASGSATNAAASATAAQNSFTLADAARVAAQSAANDAETAAELIDMDATASDVGKAIIVKTVSGGKVTAYEFGESGGGGGTGGIVNVIEDAAIASFDDGTDAPVVELVVGINAVQSGSGDPALDNVRLITGWTGVQIPSTGINVWDEELEDGYIDYTTGTYQESDQNLRTKNKIIVKPNTSYRFYCGNSGAQRRFGYAFYDANNVFISGGLQDVNGNITAPNNACYFAWFVPKSWYGNVYNNDISINFPSTDTSYHAYTGETYSVTFPIDAGTVYGGTLTCLNGVWKLRTSWVKLILNGTQTIAVVNWRSTEHTVGWLYSALNQTQALNGNIVCESLPTILNMNVFASADYPAIAIQRDVQYGIAVKLADMTLTTKEAINAYLAQNPITVIYEIANPVEYTITDTEIVNLLAGYNNVWADTGDIQLLKYIANGKQYVDEKDSLVKALIAKELNSMIADTALVANDFRIVNNTLYKITASVASGGTLTPGTNCAATTVSEILKTLLT